MIEGQQFSVILQLENYVVNDYGIHGELCLRDGLTENFGGIPETACNPINLDSAKKDQNGNIAPPKPGVYNFGPYSYKGGSMEFASLSQTQIIADVKYEVEEKARSSICVQRSSISQSVCSEQQNLRIDQPDLPLKVSSIKATTLGIQQSTTNVLLEITLSKTQEGQLVSSGEILTSSLPGMALVSFDIAINGAPAKCTGLVNGNMLEVTQDQNQKVIKCSTSIILNQDYIQEAPIEMRMGYGFIQSINGPVVKFGKTEVSL